MSRLGAEYDPAEHHDLDRIETDEPRLAAGDRYVHVGYCACGDFTDREASVGDARREHEKHRDEELGIGCP